METMRRINLDEVPLTAVILFDTEDGLTWKVIFVEEDDRNPQTVMANVIISADEGDGESDSEYAVLAGLTVGKPLELSWVRAPHAGGPMTMSTEIFTKVTKIEVYD